MAEEKKHSPSDNALLFELDDYLTAIRGYSQNTAKSYHNDLIQFFRFLTMRFHLLDHIDKPSDESEIDIGNVDAKVLSKVDSSKSIEEQIKDALKLMVS